MEEYVKAIEVAEFRHRAGRNVRIAGINFAIFLINDNVYAVENDCPHQHFSMLHEGELHECIVTCPMHGWSFDLRTGAAVRGNGRLKRHRAKTIDGEVWIILEPLKEGRDGG